MICSVLHTAMQVVYSSESIMELYRADRWHEQSG